MAGPYDSDSFSAGIATKQLKVLNPDDTTEVIQIGIVDTGLTTVPGEKIFSLLVGGTAGPVPSLPTSIPVNTLISVTATAAALTTQALVNGAVLRAPAGNLASVWIGGDNTVTVGDGYELEPGESVPVTINNLNKLFIIGNAADKLQWLGG